MKTFSTYFKTFLAAMLLLVGSNYVGAAEPNWTDYAVVPEVGKNYYIYNKTRGRFICFQGTSVTNFDPTRTSITLGPTTGSSATERGNQAVLFKLESGTTSGYYKIKVVDQFGGKTWYMSSSMYSVSTSAQSNIAITEAGTASGKNITTFIRKVIPSVYTWVPAQPQAQAFRMEQHQIQEKNGISFRKRVLKDVLYRVKRQTEQYPSLHRRTRGKPL